MTSGFLVDAEGQTSEQLDVIIFDRFYSPLLFDQNGVQYLPAESAYAVFEVKQDLTKGHIEYAANKIASARRLKRSSAGIVDRGVKKPAREIHELLGGVLTTKSGWSPPFGKAWSDVLSELDAEHRIDLGVIVTAGAFEVTEHGSRTCGEEGALMFFILALLRRLQDIGTVPAIDWTQYEAALEDGDD